MWGKAAECGIKFVFDHSVNTINNKQLIFDVF